MNFADRLRAAFGDGAFGQLEQAYLHRARRADSLGELVGRDALIASDIALAAQIGTAEVSAFTTSTVTLTARGFRQHRWIEREGERILHEWIVSDLILVAEERAARGELLGAAYPAQPPLGELRSGRGQLSAGPTAAFTGEPQALIDTLHRIWNGRCLDQLAALYSADGRWSGPGGKGGDADAARAWILGLLARLPDATLLFERVEAEADRVALLWRLFGHIGGVRARLIGSSLLTLDEDGRIREDDTLIDELALEATPHRAHQVIVR